MRVKIFQFKRWLISSALACLGSVNVYAQAGFTWKYEPRSLGAADRYGYALWTVPLAKLILGGETIPLRAEFSTDPRSNPSPSPLGRGWSINFFSSALIEENQNSLRWHRPDGRIFFFSLERGNAVDHKRGTNDPIVFHSTENTWIATKEPRKRLITLTHSESGAEFLYEDGLLVRFSFSSSVKDEESYSISYNRLRRPARLAESGSGKLIVEFTYENPERAKTLTRGEANLQTDKPIAFEYTTAELNLFDSGPYLSKIGDNGLPLLNIKYSREKTEANSIELERSGISSISSLIWEAKTGFITKDQGASYKIENPSLADGGKPAVDPKVKRQVTDYNWRPDEAKVTRTDLEGKTEFRFYDRSKGMAMVTNKQGITTVTSYLLSNGPNYGKVRKIEEIQEGKTRTLVRNAYDDSGRLLRRIEENGAVALWEYGVDYSREYLNENLIKESKFADGQKVYEKIFHDGQIIEKHFSRLGSQIKESKWVNGKFTWEQITERGQLVSRVYATGETLATIPGTHGSVRFTSKELDQATIIWE